MKDGTDCFFGESWNLTHDILRSTPRIGILGAHGVGKTTLAEALALELNIPKIDEIARTVHKIGFPLDLQADIKTQAIMWLGQLYEEFKAPTFVADRTVLDPVVYGTELSTRLQWSAQDRIYMRALANVSYLIFKQQYTHIIYVPIEFELQADGVRNTDIEYQQKIDQGFKTLIESFSIEHLTVSGSIDERLAMAMSYCTDTGPSS